ncbi:putative PIF1 DNA helicase/replication protein A1-like protein [Tanacetum coccineum]
MMANIATACEAAWRIYGFDIHYRNPSVERLPFHLKDEQHVIFDVTKSIDYAVDKSSVNETKFESWMQLNQTDTFARTLVYVKDDKEYIDGLLEASFWGMGDYLCSIFVMLIMTDSMSWPEVVWGKTWSVMAADVLSVKRIKQELEMSDIQRKNICLTYIEWMLRSNNRILKDIKKCRILIKNTRWMDITVDSNKGEMFFVYGYGSTRKTYLYKTISVALRSKGEIVLNVASGGVAAFLLEGERTTHSRFAIPVNVVWCRILYTQ